jgi:hypothetical protein
MMRFIKFWKRWNLVLDEFERLVRAMGELVAISKSREDALERLLLAKVKESEAIRKVAENKLEREIAETPSEYDKRF